MAAADLAQVLHLQEAVVPLDMQAVLLVVPPAWNALRVASLATAPRSVALVVVVDNRRRATRAELRDIARRNARIVLDSIMLRLSCMHISTIRNRAALRSSNGFVLRTCCHFDN